jgi:hypothetical protein
MNIKQLYERFLSGEVSYRELNNILNKLPDKDRQSFSAVAKARLVQSLRDGSLMRKVYENAMSSAGKA